MPHVISWCGFLGAWLLFAGPLDQAVREVEDQEFEHESLEEANARVGEPPPVSNWWLLLPPVWWILRQRRESIYRHLVGEAMDDEDLLAFLTIKDVLSAWLYVAAGASLIAVKETWELRVAGMGLLAPRRRHAVHLHRPHGEAHASTSSPARRRSRKRLT